MKINPLCAIDFYKADHRNQYPPGTEMVYSNFTPRSGKRANKMITEGESVVFFGLQAFIKDFLIDTWDQGFFNRPKVQVVRRYKRRMDNALGPDKVDVSHIEALHDLGHLPIVINALPEGTLVPIKTPVFTIHNTLPEFFWLTNYLESVISSALWKPITTATTAYQYRKLLDSWAEKTGSDPEFVKLQAHDFSFRGMSGMEDSAMCGMGHLLSFIGTDTVLAIDAAEDFYNADSDEEVLGVSVPATEHSVMCMGTQGDEIGTFRRLINDLYTTGIVSIVSDTWDFWKVITEYLPMMKDEILARDGKVVIRPDSGDPANIICGDPSAEKGSPEYKGAVECMWDIFGGTETEKGFRVLDEHIGLIYGDSITLDRAEDIMARLAMNRFASSNVVLGVGSYTYQYATRDTYGMAMKATYGEVNGEEREIFKAPKTDSGAKKSARGLLYVCPNTLALTDQVSWELMWKSALRPVFISGNLVVDDTFDNIRRRLHGDAMDCFIPKEEAA